MDCLSEKSGNVFTVDVEEYFQVETFSDCIKKKDWERYPSRIEGQITRILEILDAYTVRATFFVLGWVAERHPDLVREIKAKGHEIASHGHDHSMITKISPEEFRKDIRTSKEILEKVTNSPVRGYRAPTFSITEKTAWAYRILLEEGYQYSSSVYPIWHDRYGWPKFGVRARKMASNGKENLWEIPLSVVSIGSVNIPAGGGGYLRIYPVSLTKAFFRQIMKMGQIGMVYIHPWELDTGQPAVKVPFLRHLRHYYGIGGMEGKIKELLGSFEFGRVRDIL